MTNLERRISELEKKANINNEEIIIIKVVDYSSSVKELSEEEVEERVAEARAKGEKFIVVSVPYKPEKANLGE